MAIHEDGVVNVSESLVRQARKDFIKGAKILYGTLKKIPTQKELYSSAHPSLTNRQDVRMMYDSWRFVSGDPYQFFGDVGETIIINSWKKEAILEYYKELYLDGAIAIFLTKPGSNDIHLLTDGEAAQRINDNEIFKNYLEAKNYICSLSDYEELVKNWNMTAIDRCKRAVKKKGKGRILIQDTKYHKALSMKRRQNIEKAKKMHNDGLSLEEIAEELGVTAQCIRVYLRS